MNENYYTLTREIDEKWTPKIKDYIEKLKADKTIKPLNLTGIGELNPSRVRDILIDKLGYDEDKADFNGWEWDYWFYFKQKGMPSLTLRGTGMTFELYLQFTEE